MSEQLSWELPYAEKISCQVKGCKRVTDSTGDSTSWEGSVGQTVEKSKEQCWSCGRSGGVKGTLSPTEINRRRNPSRRGRRKLMIRSEGHRYSNFVYEFENKVGNPWIHRMNFKNKGSQVMRIGPRTRRGGIQPRTPNIVWHPTTT